MREFAQNEASQSVEEEVRKIEGAGGKVEMVHVAVGHPDSEILRIAEEIGADLVVVGSRGLGPLKKGANGECLRKRRPSRPLLRARCAWSGPRRRYLPGRVLLALDGSKGAGEAEQIAAEISAATGSVLDIVRVLEAELYRPYPGLSTGRVGRPTSSAPSVKSRPFWTNARGAYGPRGSRLATPTLRSAIRTRR